MKAELTYVCGICGKRINGLEVFAHGATHYFLTTEEYLYWQSLKAEVKERSYDFKVNKNAWTDMALCMAIMKLSEFEHEHNLQE